MTTWDPSQYARHRDHRNRPFLDLLARIPNGSPAVVVDLGCGDGSQTVALGQRWPQARIIGTDSSPEMIAAARRDHGERIDWLVQDVNDFRRYADEELGGSVDVLLSNAVLQWVPEHRELLATWAQLLTPGGTLAFQVPGNFEAPSHRIIREVAAAQPRGAELTSALRHDRPVDDPADYAEQLGAVGLTPDCWETTYVQLLDPAGELANPVLDWVKGTALRPLLDLLTGPDERAAFLADLDAALLSAYPRGSLGVAFPFRRIFAVASRSAGPDEPQPARSMQ